jgi:predicted Zn-dependent peptidase
VSARRTSKRAARPARRTRRAGARFERLREPLVGGEHLSASTSSGTRVVVRPMRGFAKAYAMLATRYGSLDVRLPDGSDLPVGIAHFLEHKMFETPDGDVFDLYAKRGASANAYTTFGHTVYLFSCTSRFEENLDTLLLTLRRLHAGKEGIEREKGIIGQEIAMYDDDASWRGFFDLLAALYRDHPLRLDIAGTRETIAPIDADVLRRTHAAYYHPANLSLFVAGGVDPDVVLDRAEEGLPADGPGRENRRAPVPEPAEVARPEVRSTLSVARPHVRLGIKDVPVGEGGAALARRDVETSMLLDVLFGDGGRVEAPLYRDGVVDETLDASYECDQDYAFAVVAAEVDDEEPFRARLLDEVEAARRRPLEPVEVERARRRALGAYLRAWNAPERAASLLLGTHMSRTTLAQTVDAIEGATPARLSERLEALWSRPRAWSVVSPRGGRESRPVGPAPAQA